MSSEKKQNRLIETKSLKTIGKFTYALLHLCIFASALFFTFHFSHFTNSPAFADGTKVLKAGVSIEKVPKEFYGTWRVSSSLITTNTPELFKKTTVDLWNLSRVGDVITLDNPFTGAHASIMVEDLKGMSIRFRKIGDYDSKKLTDTVQLNLSKETFTGINTLKFDTISDGHVIKTETATYQLSGEKISGQSIK